MRVLITGATGFLGGHIARRLTRAGHLVVPAGRNEMALRCAFPAATQVAVIDYARITAPEDLCHRLTEIEAVVNAVGLIRERQPGDFATVHTNAPGALFRACREAGVRRILQISALGADAAAVTRYHRSKRAADEALAALGGRMDWTVLRPSLVYGPGGGSTALFAAIAALPLQTRIGAGGQQMQPIHVEDFAEMVLRLLERPDPLPRRLDIGGPAPVAFENMLAAYRDWLGLGPAPVVSLPPGAMRLAARLGTRLGSGPVTTESLDMLLAGNTCDPGPAIAATGV